MRRENKGVKAIYTIEAAILIPFVVFVMAASIHLGIALYTEIKSEAIEYGEIEKIDEVKKIHEYRKIGTIWEEFSEK